MAFITVAESLINKRSTSGGGGMMYFGVSLGEEQWETEKRRRISGKFPPAIPWGQGCRAQCPQVSSLPLTSTVTLLLMGACRLV